MLLYYSEYHAPYHGNSIILHMEHRTNLLLVPSSDIFPLHDEHDLHEEKCLMPLVMALVTSVSILLVKSDSSVVTSLMSSIFLMFPSSLEMISFSDPHTHVQIHYKTCMLYLQYLILKYI